MVALVISSHLPEFAAIATLAGIEKDRLADAFNEPGESGGVFKHLTLGDLERLQTSAEHWARIQSEMLDAMGVYADAAKAYLESKTKEA